MVRGDPPLSCMEYVREDCCVQWMQILCVVLCWSRKRMVIPHQYMVHTNGLESPTHFNCFQSWLASIFQKKLHGKANILQYAIHYQLAAVIQAMRCGSLDVIKLARFLEMPCGNKIAKHLQRFEKMMGTIQVALKNESKLEAVQEEIKPMKVNGNFSTHECSVQGHEHLLLSQTQIIIWYDKMIIMFYIYINSCVPNYISHLYNDLL